MKPALAIDRPGRLVFPANHAEQTGALAGGQWRAGFLPCCTFANHPLSCARGQRVFGPSQLEYLLSFLPRHSAAAGPIAPPGVGHHQGSNSVTLGAAEPSARKRGTVQQDHMSQLQNTYTFDSVRRADRQAARASGTTPCKRPQYSPPFDPIAHWYRSAQR